MWQDNSSESDTQIEETETAAAISEVSEVEEEITAKTTTTSAEATTTATEALTETMTSTIEVPAVSVDYVNSYGAYILESADRINQNSIYREYYLYDINGDSIYELIAHFGNSESEAVYKIWTIDGADLTYCGDFSGGNTQLYAEDSILYANKTSMGWQNISTVSIANKEVSLTTYFESEDGTMEEYMEIGEALISYDFSDQSILSTYSTADLGYDYYASYNDF